MPSPNINNPVTVDHESIGRQLVSGNNTTVNLSVSGKISIDVPNNIQPLAGLPVWVNRPQVPAGQVALGFNDSYKNLDMWDGYKWQAITGGDNVVHVVDSNTDPTIIGQMYWCMNRQGITDKQVTIWFQGYSNPDYYDIRFPTFFQYGYSIQQTQWLPNYGPISIAAKSTQNLLLAPVPMVPSVGGIGFTGCVLLSGF